jgi:WD40 repeat protein
VQEDHAMLLTRVKIVLTILLATTLAGVVTLGTGALAGNPSTQADKKKAEAPDKGKKEAEDPARDAALRTQSANNLKQIALALHNYHDTHKGLPAPAITGKDGKPLLSWRVAILPYIEQDALYRQFKLDEPWDSPHNKKLIAQMPPVYAPVRGPTKKVAGGTYYQAFVGKGTAFEPGKKLALQNFTDGTSNTLVVAEGATPVPWTSPVDLAYTRGKPLPKLGGEFGGNFHAARGDGSVGFFKKDVDPQALSAAIERGDGGLVQILDGEGGSPGDIKGSLGPVGPDQQPSAGPPPPPPPPPPPITDPEGVTFGLRSSSLDERRGGQVLDVAFAPDGNTVAAVGSAPGKPGYLKLWDAATGKERASLRQAVAIRAIAFSPDGKQLLTGEDDGTVRLRDPATGKPRSVLGRHGKSVSALAFAPGGQLLAVAGPDGAIGVWELAPGKSEKKTIQHGSYVGGLTFGRDGKTLLASGSLPKVWDVSTGKEVRQLAVGGAWASLAPDGKLAAVAVNRMPTLVSVETGKPLPTPKEDFENNPGLYNRGSAQAIAYTPDGKTLITAHGKGRVVLWDAKTLKELADLGAPADLAEQPVFGTVGGAVTVSPSPSPSSIGGPMLAVSTDGKRLAATADKSIVLWDLSTKKRLDTLTTLKQGVGAPAPVLALAYSPDGKALAVALDDRTVSIRERATGEQLARLRGHTDLITALAFAPDSKRVVTASADHTVRVWDAGTGKELLAFKGHGNWVYALAFSPDGQLVASGGYDRKIRLWDPASGKEHAVLEGHKGAVRALAFAPKGQLLASGSSDRTIKLWDVLTRRDLATLTGHEAVVRSLAFAPDGKRLASGSDDNTARLWDVGGRKQFLSKKHGNAVMAVAFSPSGSRFATASLDRSVRLWDTKTGAPRGQLAAVFTDGTTAAAFAPGGREFATGSLDRQVLLWPAVTVPVRLLKGDPSPLSAAALSPDGKRVLAGGGPPMSPEARKQRAQLERGDIFGFGLARADYVLRLWDADTGKQLRRLDGHTEQVLGVAFVKGGKRAVSAGRDGTVRLWNLETGKQVHSFTGHQKPVLGVAVAPDGRLAASAGEDNLVRLWDLETLKPVRQFGDQDNRYPCRPKAVAFSPDGKRLLVGDRAGYLRLYDVAGKDKPRRFNTAGAVEGVAFLPDGKRALCAADQTVELWDVQAGRRLRSLTGHQSRVDRVAALPDGKRVVSVGQDGAARFWDVEKGTEVTRLNSTPSHAPVAPPMPPVFGAPTAVLAPPPPDVKEVPPAVEEKKAAKQETAKEVKKAAKNDPPTPQPPPPPPSLPPVPGGMPGGMPVAPVTFDWPSLVSVSADGRRILTTGVGRQIGGNPWTQAIQLWSTLSLDRSTLFPGQGGNERVSHRHEP